MEKLKYLRNKNKLSHRQMGELLGISKTFYWQLENDFRKLSYERAIDIASIFKLKPDDIFYDEFVKKNKD